MPAIFRVLLTTIVALVLAGSAFVALQPSAFTISRNVSILAPPAKVFARINDLHEWQAWSPWAELDPKQVVAFEGPKSGVGAIMRWSGNSEVGRGGMAIVESVAPKTVKYRLDFVEPMEATNFANFDVEPEGESTRVTWTLTGQRDFFEKFVWLVLGIQGGIEKQFDTGLQNLKRYVQANP